MTYLVPLELPLLHSVVVVPFAAHDDDFLLSGEGFTGVRAVGDNEGHGDAPERAGGTERCQRVTQRRERAEWE